MGRHVHSATATCSVPWGICPVCTLPLGLSAGQTWCEWCGQTWAEGERAPCPDPATVEVHDATGAAAWMCRAHADCCLRALARDQEPLP